MGELIASEALSGGQAPSLKRRAEAPLSDGRRWRLRHYDLVASKALNPMGSSGLEDANDASLWKMMVAGDKQALYFSEICDSDPQRRAVGISRFAEVYSLALRRVIEGNHSAALFKESVIEQVKEEADQLLATLDKLKSVAHAKTPPTRTYTRSEVEDAAKKLHAWLRSDSRLRSFIAYMSGGGVFWAAYAHERGIRAFIKAGGGTPFDMAEAMASQLSSSVSGGGTASTTDALYVLEWRVFGVFPLPLAGLPNVVLLCIRFLGQRCDICDEHRGSWRAGRWLCMSCALLTSE